MTTTPAEGFLIYYEKCLVSHRFKFDEYFDKQFGNKSPLKLSVNYHDSTEKVMLSLCNSILKT